MQVIEIAERLPDCKHCRKIEKDEIEEGQKIALFFKPATLVTRKLHSVNNVGFMGIAKSIRRNESRQNYSIEFESATLLEVIISSIEVIILVCEDCEKKYSQAE